MHDGAGARGDVIVDGPRRADYLIPLAELEVISHLYCEHTE